MGIPGMVDIGKNEIGIVFKKLGLKLGSKLPPGKKIALNGEAGYQADILPPGQHFGYFPWQYEIRREPIIDIPQGEIGLIVAKDGQPISQGKILGRVVECNNFQDARAFLEHGGEKGRQLGILTSGEYLINTELFTVITSINAHEHNVNPEDLKVYEVPPDTIGIVTTEDGQTISAGEIAGVRVEGHNKFQDPQRFIDLGGYKGLQSEILPTGSWNLNPWFAKVELAPLTKVEPGRVGVVVSHIGKTSVNTDSDTLVSEGYKGVWKKPLYPGKHPINTRVMDVVIVPTHQITLDWTNREKPSSNYDANLRALKLRSKDGFSFDIELTQVLSIGSENAPKMILRIGSPARKLETTEDIEAGAIRFGSIKNLVTRVLEPMIGNYFRNSAQNFEALEFHEYRSQRQNDAIDYIRPELEEYGVNSVGTFINEIDLPDELENILTERKINQEGIKADQIRHQRRLQERKAESEETEAQINQDRIRRNFEIESKQQEIHLNAESIRLQGIAEAEVIEAKISAEVRALGGYSNYITKLRTENWSQIKLPNVLVGSHNGLLEAFIAPMLDSSTPQAVLANSAQLRLSGDNHSHTPQLEAALPRCPVIFLLDTSSSLSNEYLDKLIEGINTFEQQLSKDETASQCIEVSIITFGESAKVVQPFSNASSFSLHKFELNGQAATGRGIELALKMIENRQKRYSSQNIQHYQPWVFLITGSNPDDNWQEPVQQVKQLVGEQKLNFLTVGVENADINILSQIASPKSPPTMLESLKFKPLFYGLADLMKIIAHRQKKENILDDLGNAVEEARSSLPPEQAEAIEEYAAKIMSEVSKKRPSRQEYSSNAANLYKTAKELGEEGQSITEILPNITKTLGFN